MTCRALFSALVAMLIAVPTCVAAGPASGEKTLLLYAKNPATWRIVEAGGAGRLRYAETTGRFSFAAWGLAAETEYALVRHADDPASGRILARGVSDRQGALQLSGSWQDWTQKFWLVPAADLTLQGDRARLTNWHPERYLFENKLLGIPCDCDE